VGRLRELRPAVEEVGRRRRAEARVGQRGFGPRRPWQPRFFELRGDPLGARILLEAPTAGPRFSGPAVGPTKAAWAGRYLNPATCERSRGPVVVERSVIDAKLSHSETNASSGRFSGCSPLHAHLPGLSQPTSRAGPRRL